MTLALAVALLMASVLAGILWQRERLARREAHIRGFAFPKGVFAKVIARHPHISQKEMELVSRGLRQFFMAYHQSGYRHVAMPSQVADDLWHEFILYTRHYQAFCQQAFGRFLHHTPAVVLSRSQQLGNEGLRRCWRHVCREENINPRRPSRLPLLFALDSKLAIAGGFVYVADCSGPRREGAAGDGTNVYCGGDFSDGSIDGGTAGFDDAGDAGSHSSGGHGGHHGSDSGSTSLGDHGGNSGDGGSSDGGSSCSGSSCGGGCGGD